jgi:predicted hydrocarbon binding protein
MISISDLVNSHRLPGNYFASSVYIRGDLELGLLETRRGDRLLALPDTLLQAIYSGLDKETGQASRLVLFNCGKWWGKNFYVRFCEEVSDYYGTPVAQMTMVEFLQCLQQCWKTLGWGVFELDTTYYEHGFLEVKLDHSPFAQNAPSTQRPVCYLEAGILSSFFSQLTGRDLNCIQTTCESLGAEHNRFIIGLPERLKPAEEWVAEGQEHDVIMEKLCV